MAGGLFCRGNVFEPVQSKSLGVGLLVDSALYISTGVKRPDQKSLTTKTKLFKERLQGPGQDSEAFFLSCLSASITTVFLISKTIAVTAGHGIQGGGTLCGGLKPDEVAIVFGHRVTNQAGKEQHQVYQVQSVLDAEYSPMALGADYAVLELDRPVHNYQPLTVAEVQPQASMGVSLYGHTLGLPLLKTHGYLKDQHQSHEWLAAMASMSGFSGGPVMDEQHRVIGLLAGVEGPYSSDYRYRDGELQLEVRCRCEPALQPLAPCACESARITPASYFAGYV